MTKIKIAECRLLLSRTAKVYEAPALRSFFGATLADGVVADVYDSEGRPRFEYPRVQFKVFDSTAVLWGINEGCELLERLWPGVDLSNLGGEQHQVVEARFETRSETLASTAEPVEYRFQTPWLALNQKNFNSYVGSRNQKFRKDELSRIVVGNCLGMAKSLAIRFEHHITADCRKLTSIKTTLNGQGVIGFIGKFTVNLTLPEYLGLGKSAARGFGTVASR